MASKVPNRGVAVGLRNGFECIRPVLGRPGKPPTYGETWAVLLPLERSNGQLLMQRSLSTGLVRGFRGRLQVARKPAKIFRRWPAPLAFTLEDKEEEYEPTRFPDNNRNRAGWCDARAGNRERKSSTFRRFDGQRPNRSADQPQLALQPFGCRGGT